MSFRGAQATRNLTFPLQHVTPGTDPGSIPGAFHSANGCQISVRHDRNVTAPSRGGWEGMGFRWSFRPAGRNLNEIDIIIDKMKKNKKYIASAIVTLLIIPSLLFAECLNYEPDFNFLTGKIIQETFPGPPNYESIRNGDEPETYCILILAESLCVNAKADNPLYSSESEIKRIQLVLKGNEYQKYKNLIGEEVIVHGQLFPMQTGHHHTKVLMIVKDIRRINR
jgi:hypothetical protein